MYYRVTRGSLDTHCHTNTGPWPPLHIPIIVRGRSVGLFDFSDGNLAIFRLPALGGLLDLPGLALRGGILDLYVNVGHGTCLSYSPKYNITGRGRDPKSNGEQRWPNRRNYSRMFSERTVGGVWDLNLEE